MKVAIIGGGAAGMMAAAAIMESRVNAEIFLLEKNAVLGRKVVISGGGRCNVTTWSKNPAGVLENYPRGSKFLISAMTNFPPEKVYNWFEAHGVALKNEEDLRVFPKSDDGRDIIRVFEKLLPKNNCHILLKTEVQNIARDRNRFIIETRNSSTIIADKVIITTGGQAYRFTGSCGDGYNFAENLGHTITKLAPSLNSFITREVWPKNLAGVSLKNAIISSGRDKKHKFTGPFVFTHRGLSGPAVFALSSLVAFEDYGKNNPLPVYIDLLPGLNSQQLENEIQKARSENPRSLMKNSLNGLLPKSLLAELLILLKIPQDKRNNHWSRKEIQALIFLIKNLGLHVCERGAGDEFVTAGGVNLKEVNSSTMESKICPGLYFAGEILDVDGFTGGFNLQASWSTGRLAGESAVG